MKLPNPHIHDSTLNITDLNNVYKAHKGFENVGFLAFIFPVWWLETWWEAGCKPNVYKIIVYNSKYYNNKL